MDPRALTVRFNELINDRDLESLGALMTADHTFIDSAGRVLCGKARCLDAWRTFFASFPDYYNVFELFEVQGTAVAVAGYSVCSDARLDGEALWVARVTDGRIAEWRICDDTPANRRLLNLPPFITMAPR